MQIDMDRVEEMALEETRKIFYENYHCYPDQNENTTKYKAIYRTCYNNAVVYFQREIRNSLITVLLKFMSEQDIKQIFSEVGIDFSIYYSKREMNPKPEYRFQINKYTFMRIFVEEVVIPKLEKELGICGLKPNNRLSLESKDILDWSAVEIGQKEN